MIHHLVELFALSKMGGFVAPKVDNFAQDSCFSLAGQALLRCPRRVRGRHSGREQGDRGRNTTAVSRQSVCEKSPSSVEIFPENGAFSRGSGKPKRLPDRTKDADSVGTPFRYLFLSESMGKSRRKFHGRCAEKDRGRLRAVIVDAVTVGTVRKVVVLRESAVDFHDQRSKRKSISWAFLW